MNRARCAALAAGLVLAASASATAQDIVWKQTLNLPKGLNLPRDLVVDILGIAPGDTYADVKRKIDALRADVKPTPAPPPAPAKQPPPKSTFPGLEPSIPLAQMDAGRLDAQESLERRNAAEMNGEDQRGALSETRTVIRLPVPGGQMNASYIGSITLKRRIPAVTPRGADDFLRVIFSAPSSGHQVYAIERNLSYNTDADQPRVGELLAQLKAKFGGAMQAVDLGPVGKFLFQFDNGQLIAPANPKPNGCFPQMNVDNNRVIPEINRDGNCDVVLVVEVSYGISRDHARQIKFLLGDNERAKANVAADFVFMQAYVDGLRAQTKGVTPKL